MDVPTEASYLYSNATGLKEKLALGRAVVLGRVHVPAGRDALQVSRSVATSERSVPKTPTAPTVSVPVCKLRLRLL